MKNKKDKIRDLEAHKTQLHSIISETNMGTYAKTKELWKEINKIDEQIHDLKKEWTNWEFLGVLMFFGFITFIVGTWVGSYYTLNDYRCTKFATVCHYECLIDGYGQNCRDVCEQKCIEYGIKIMPRNETGFVWNPSSIPSNATIINATLSLNTTTVSKGCDSFIDFCIKNNMTCWCIDVIPVGDKVYIWSDFCVKHPIKYETETCIWGKDNFYIIKSSERIYYFRNNTCLVLGAGNYTVISETLKTAEFTIEKCDWSADCGKQVTICW